MIFIMNFKCCGKESVRVMNVAKTFDFLRAVADRNRLKILCVLQSGPKCVCELVPIISISNKLASHHLKQLKEIGLLVENREGKFIRYGLDKKAIKEYKKILNQVIK